VRLKLLFLLSALGLLLGLVSAYLYSRQDKPQAPVFNPAPNPYANGVYASGILESHQTHGANISIFPEVSGPVTRILVAEGDVVKAGAPLRTIDASVQTRTVESLEAQAAAAAALLAELKAAPRREPLEIAAAQLGLARATLKSATDSQDKLEQSFAADPQSISREALDSARNASKIAAAGLEVAQRQWALIKAGAWAFDIENQEKLVNSLGAAAAAARALLEKYTLHAPNDGVVMTLQAAVGTSVSPQGAYDLFTGSDLPLIVMGGSPNDLEVRAYVDEILISRLPASAKMIAKMTIQGTDISIPLSYERMQPYVSPKIELSDQRAERVDVRVLPIIFQFQTPPGMNLYQGQLVDVYIGTQ
jgi:HlyD family secretion protein